MDMSEENTSSLPQFEWTTQKEEAAFLISEGSLPETEIAEQIGAHRTTLYIWRQNPIFQGRIQEHIEERKAQLKQRGITDRQNRLDLLNKTVEGLKMIIEERAQSTDYDGVPGGRSGLLDRVVRGQSINFPLDDKLIKAVLDISRQAAQESGQWSDKSQVDATTKTIVEVVHVEKPREEE